ncbi:hypothetical protein [Pseudomonas sp. LS-2]|uniref:hypothetical protein n=1 Tax=Pseudomonas sp. LS-2 TaxID=2315859 RepID=UPI000E738423|nr:hypothetical protein [Pseudomonas sp. LS-2]RJX72645.1 hypothetical protein D3M70_31075 [Pseudomonas sp. LS-2]
MQFALALGDESFDFNKLAVASRLPRHRRVKAEKLTSSDIEQLYLNLLAMPDDQLEEFVWTDSDVDLLREKLLFEACHVLLDKRAAVATRRDRWSWIMSESSGPFSFLVCAYFAGVRGVELRESLTYLCRREKVIDQLESVA